MFMKPSLFMFTHTHTRTHTHTHTHTHTCMHTQAVKEVIRLLSDLKTLLLIPTQLCMQSEIWRSSHCLIRNIIDSGHYLKHCEQGNGECVKVARRSPLLKVHPAEHDANVTHTFLSQATGNQTKQNLYTLIKTVLTSYLASCLVIIF